LCGPSRLEAAAHGATAEGGPGDAGPGGAGAPAHGGGGGRWGSTVVSVHL
jgi:hypothetical protein